MTWVHRRVTDWELSAHFPSAEARSSLEAAAATRAARPVPAYEWSDRGGPRAHRAAIQGGDCERRGRRPRQYSLPGRRGHQDGHPFGAFHEATTRRVTDSRPRSPSQAASSLRRRKAEAARRRVAQAAARASRSSSDARLGSALSVARARLPVPLEGAAGGSGRLDAPRGREAEPLGAQPTVAGAGAPTL